MKVHQIFHKKVLYNKGGLEVASGSCFRKKITHFKYIDVLDSRRVLSSRPNSIKDSMRELEDKGKQITKNELRHVKTISDEQLFNLFKRVIVK